MWIKVISVLIIVVLISMCVEEVVLSFMHRGFVMGWSMNWSFVMSWCSVVDWSMSIRVNLKMSRCMSWSLVMYRCGVVGWGMGSWVCRWS